MISSNITATLPSEDLLRSATKDIPTYLSCNIMTPRNCNQIVKSTIDILQDHISLANNYQNHKFYELQIDSAQKEVKIIKERIKDAVDSSEYKSLGNLFEKLF